MPKITFVDHTGNEAVHDIPVGQSIMRGAIEASIDGIEAECGGQLACATCHVYLTEEGAAAFPAKDELEDDMLECAADDVRETSRLSCQLVLTQEHEGLVVTLPSAQS